MGGAHLRLPLLGGRERDVIDSDAVAGVAGRGRGSNRKALNSKKTYDDRVVRLIERERILDALIRARWRLRDLAGARKSTRI